MSNALTTWRPWRPVLIALSAVLVLGGCADPVPVSDSGTGSGANGTPPSVRPVALRVLSDRYVVCRMNADRTHTMPVSVDGLYCLTRTPDELSLVCQEHLAPTDAAVEFGWMALAVAGPLDFSLTGILAAIAGPLGAAKIPIFAVSTYDTDYVLVLADHRSAATAALTAAGHQVR